jgi:hypothetical protein
MLVLQRKLQTVRVIVSTKLPSELLTERVGWEGTVFFRHIYYIEVAKRADASGCAFLISEAPPVTLSKRVRLEWHHFLTY